MPSNTPDLVVGLSHPRAHEHTQVGGKGANLGKLHQAGFRVPDAFTVTVSAYESFIREADLGPEIEKLLTESAHGNPDDLEALTARLRSTLIEAPVPDSLTAEVRRAYGELGSERFVAVRSSGTAEDLAGASFAGLHDTILGVRGMESVLQALKECWASMWSARAVSYRRERGFDTLPSIAVVVQVLVDSDIAGVLFTGNPMTGSTREFVVNANWGLGESVVSGLVTPDEYYLRSTDLTPHTRNAGRKSCRIDRDPVSGDRTRTVDIPAPEQDQLCMTDDQLATLGLLGRAITEHYDHIPQDIEWAFHDGVLYLLQSRPITGATFAWDECLDDWQTTPDDESYVWSRAWADQTWTGAITPLMYSYRASMYTAMHVEQSRLWGHEDTAALRLFRYHKGEAYQNAEIVRLEIGRSHPAARAGLLSYLPVEWREQALATRFSYLDYLRMHARLFALSPDIAVHQWTKRLYSKFIDNPEQIALTTAPTTEVLERMSDRELKQYIVWVMDFERRYYWNMWTGMFIHARDAMSLLSLLVASWYDGDNKMAFADLLTGIARPTATMRENSDLWELTDRIRREPKLRQLVDSHPGRAFFEQLPNSPEGQEFARHYQDFLDAHGHRGAADRDLYFDRRREDPGIDYDAIRALLSAADDADPKAKHQAVSARRQEVIDEVTANIRSKPLGGLKTEAFKVVLAYVHEFLVFRDDERYFSDRLTWAAKKALLEMNRRLSDRGQVNSDRDFYFLSHDELFDLFERRANPTWTAAKIAGRMTNFDRFAAKEWAPPMYIQDDKPLALIEDSPDETSMTGMPTSRGVVTGTARVVRSLNEIGSVREGDILITNSTDPGWTPVFMVLKGIVLETGGMLAHGSCLAREYGLPAIQLDRAMARIPNGATITLDGESGTVLIEADPA